MLPTARVGPLSLLPDCLSPFGVTPGKEGQPGSMQRVSQVSWGSESLSRKGQSHTPLPRQAHSDSKTSLGKQRPFWVPSPHPLLVSVQVVRPLPYSEHPEFRMAQKYFQKLGSFRLVPTRKGPDLSRPEGHRGGP